MATNANPWNPLVSDRLIKDWLRGKALGSEYDFKIVKGCLLTGDGELTLSISSGKVMIGGILVDFNAFGYTSFAISTTYYVYAGLDLVENTTGNVTGYSFNFECNTSDASTKDYYFKVATFGTDGDKRVDGATIDYGLGETWYPYSAVKVMPVDFVSNIAASPAYMVPGGTSVTIAAATAEALASVKIPRGWKATRGIAYDDGTGLTYVFYSGVIGTAAATSKGTETCGTEVDLTDVSADGNNYLLLEIANVNTKGIYGGLVRIEMVEA